YAHALDKGWHVGAVGAEDLGHHYGDDWGAPGQAKTVIMATERSAPSLKAAMLARHFYAIAHPGYSLDYTVDGAMMGSRLARAPGEQLRFAAKAVAPAGTGPVRLELVTNGGRVVGSGDNNELSPRHAWAPAETRYFVRAVQGGRSQAPGGGARVGDINDREAAEGVEAEAPNGFPRRRVFLTRPAMTAGVGAGLAATLSPATLVAEAARQQRRQHLPSPRNL